VGREIKMRDDPSRLAFMSSFDPSEPAILHDRISGNVETWTGEDKGNFRKTSIAKPDGTIVEAVQFAGRPL
jgi:hypothetical protein